MRRSRLGRPEAEEGGVDLRALAIVTLLSAGVFGVSAEPAIGQVQPAPPVAIVEDVNGAQAGVGVFDYLQAGHQIRLSVGDKLVLGYLASCLRETIHGGEVTVGTDQSVVTGGLVIREEVECDGGSAELSVAEASQSGVITFRQGPGSEGRGTRSNPIRIFSLQPVFVFTEQTPELTIHRLDRSQVDLRFPIRKTWLNFADHDLSLVSGGLYEARVGAAKLVFEIASHASVGGPLVGRVIRF